MKNYLLNPKPFLQHCILVAGVVFSTAFLTSCAKDQTSLDYHQKMVNRQISLFQSISGSYRGQIINKKDQSVMGVVQIDLSPQISTINSSDNTSTSAQAFLSGTVTIFSGTQSSATIKTASFFSPDGSANGTLVGNISIPLSNGTQASLSLNGTIEGSQLKGSIMLNDRLGIVGQFDTLKNQDLDVLLEQTRAPVQNQTISSYGGVNTSTSSSNTNSGVKMTVRNIGNTSAENFVNHFSLQRIVSIQLTLAEGIDGVSFNTAELDLQNGQIHAQTYYQGSINTQVSLECSQTQIQSKQAWSCTYMSSFNGVTHRFTVAKI